MLPHASRLRLDLRAKIERWPRRPANTRGKESVLKIFSKPRVSGEGSPDAPLAHTITRHTQVGNKSLYEASGRTNERAHGAQEQ